MRDIFFKPDMSSVDCVLLTVAASGFSRGEFFAPAMILAGAILIHFCTTDRWYD